jgi:hypothetical protein
MHRLVHLLKIFLIIEIARNAGKVGINEVGLFGKGDVFQVGKGNICPQVNDLHAPAF